jgi:hypothetical protein
LRSCCALAGAGFGLTRFAGGNRFAVIRFGAGLDHDRLGGIALFFANPGQGGVNRILIFRGRLNGGCLWRSRRAALSRSRRA